MAGSGSLRQREGDCTDHQKQKQVTPTAKLDEWIIILPFLPPLDYSRLAGIREEGKEPSGGKASSSCFQIPQFMRTLRASRLVRRGLILKQGDALLLSNGKSCVTHVSPFAVPRTQSAIHPHAQRNAFCRPSVHPTMKIVRPSDPFIQVLQDTCCLNVEHLTNPAAIEPALPE
jgi:hypothetical protein